MLRSFFNYCSMSFAGIFCCELSAELNLYKQKQFEKNEAIVAALADLPNMIVDVYMNSTV